MRVLIDCRMISWTGVGRYTTGLVRALAARDDVQLVLAMSPAEEPPTDAPGVELVTAPGNPFAPSGMRSFARAITAAHPDITHCVHFPTPLPATGPLIVAIQDLTPLLVVGVMPSALKRFTYRRLVARAAKVAGLVICPSQHTADDVARFFPAAEAKLRVVLDAADDFAEGPAATLTGSLAEQASGRYVLGMGSTRPHKDVPTLLAAFARLAENDPDLRLLLVGSEPAGYLSDMMSSTPETIRRRVAFTGRVDDAQLRTLYANAAVFAFPSLYEGFGLPPLEAMALGAPVVAARAASVPEVVDDAGILVEPRDPEALAQALARPLYDEAVADEMRRAGRERSSQLTWAATAEQTVAVWRELLGRHGGAR